MINLPARSLLAISITLALSTTVQAAGFALIENSASGMGNAFAGAAAVAEDAAVDESPNASHARGEDRAGRALNDRAVGAHTAENGAVHCRAGMVRFDTHEA